MPGNPHDNTRRASMMSDNAQVFSSRILSLVTACLCTLLFAAPVVSAPCSPDELALHKKLWGNSECWHPDVHKLPNGISYPNHKKLSDRYVYVINLTERTLNMGETEYPADGEDAEPEFQTLAVLPRGTYTWFNPNTVARTEELIFLADGLGAEFSYAEKMRSKAVPGPARYFYYAVEERGGTLSVREMAEPEAIRRMAQMKYEAR